MHPRQHLSALGSIRIELGVVPVALACRELVARDLLLLRLLLAAQGRRAREHGGGDARPGVALQAPDGRGLHLGAVGRWRRAAHVVERTQPRLLDLDDAAVAAVVEQEREAHPAERSGPLEAVDRVEHPELPAPLALQPLQALGVGRGVLSYPDQPGFPYSDALHARAGLGEPVVALPGRDAGDQRGLRLFAVLAEERDQRSLGLVGGEGRDGEAGPEALDGVGPAPSDGARRVQPHAGGEPREEEGAGAESLQVQVAGAQADVVEVVDVETERSAHASIDAEILQVQIADDEPFGRRRLRQRHARLEDVPGHQVEGPAEEAERARRERVELAPQRLGGQVAAVL
ncbi:MAG: hypothetical protein NVS4B10_00700 [Myxococcales bacterium]